MENEHAHVIKGIFLKIAKIILMSTSSGPVLSSLSDGVPSRSLCMDHGLSAEQIESLLVIQPDQDQIFLGSNGII